MKIIVPETKMTLRCALNHEWAGTYKCIQVGTRLRKPVMDHVYTPAKCLTCGCGCVGARPTQA